MKKVSILYKNDLREKLILSIFTKKKMILKFPGKNSIGFGLKNFEIDLLSIIDKLIKESIIEINEAGTFLIYTPGFMVENNFFHKINYLRGLSYYLEFVLYLLLFSPYKTEVKLCGLRTLNIDPTIENMVYVTIPLLRKLGMKEIKVKIFTNYLSTSKNTEIIIFSPKKSSNVNFSITDPGFLMKIRFIFTSSMGGKSFSNFVEHLSKSFPMDSSLKTRFYDLRIKNNNISFESITIVTESSTGCVYGGDHSSTKIKSVEYWKVKSLGIINSLVLESKNGSCIDGRNQEIVFFAMLILKNVRKNRIVINKLTVNSVNFFRSIKKTLSVTFSIRSNLDKNSLLITL